jgi:alpha-amylase
MGVIMQAFYWDCPKKEHAEGKWWGLVDGNLASLQADGFTALWLPPPSKCAEWNSMGYDPYDYFDLGEFDQKGNTQTWFGTRAALDKLIKDAHAAGIQVYADVVLNHNSGADSQELNPLINQQRWTKFTPKSGQFQRDWTCFHPCRYETMDGLTFGDMPDLCHRTPTVYTNLMAFAQWLIEKIGFDGFRFDFVKGYGSWVVKALAEYRYDRGKEYRPFCVGECWDSERTIDDWLSAVNSFNDNPVSAFDFPLHYKLQGLCDQFGFDVRALLSGCVIHDSPQQAVTFVDNHDTSGTANGVVSDKLLAYAFILTHEGYPCVFWQDYFNFNLAKRGTASGIAALVAAHEKYAGGGTTTLYADHDLYIMQREGFGQAPGLVLVLNNRGDSWSGTTVTTKWRTRRLQPVAWWGQTDQSKPSDKWSDMNGSVDVWAAPRGYAVYVPS